MSDMQELYCNECKKYLRFEIKPWKNGKLIIACDYCRHQYCRWVKDGIVKEARWEARNGIRVLPGRVLRWSQRVPKGMGAMANSHKLSLWEEEKLK